MKILMVCLGNICRSPMAEGILLNKTKKLNLDWKVDSAGIGHWHIGEKPDKRAILIANKYGIDITYQRARKFIRPDFEKFDKIYAMDVSVKNHLISLADSDFESEKVDLIMNELHKERNLSVHDPYYDDGLDGFEEIFRQLDEACEAIVEKYGRIKK